MKNKTNRRILIWLLVVSIIGYVVFKVLSKPLSATNIFINGKNGCVQPSFSGKSNLTFNDCLGVYYDIDIVLNLGDYGCEVTRLQKTLNEATDNAIESALSWKIWMWNFGFPRKFTGC